MPIQKVCTVCQKEFSVPPVRAAAQTCSRACKGIVDKARYQAARAVVTCKVCGTEFTAPQSHVDRRVTCSRECANSLPRDYVGFGVDSPNWKGGRIAHNGGYIYVAVDPPHPYGWKDGRYVFEHRAVMEQAMRTEAPDHSFLVGIAGRKYLHPKIHVHHIDEDGCNNRRENLVVCTNSAHKQIHAGKKPDAWEIWPQDVEVFLTTRT